MASLVLTGDTSGQVTLAAPAVAGTNTITLAAQTGTLNVAGPAFSATRTAAQSISAATWTKVQFSTEEFDTANCYDPTTNYRFTPNVAGYYFITSTVETNASSLSGVAIYKNGSVYRRMWSSNPSVGASSVISTTIYMNGTTDYVESYVYQNIANPLYTTSPDYEFSGCLLRGA